MSNLLLKTAHTVSVWPFFRLRESLMLRLVAWTQPAYALLSRRGRPAWSRDLSDLRACPEGSLGRALGRFLDARGLDLMPQFENHDVCHVLLGYDTSMQGETEMQFCLLGAGKRSLYCLGACGLALLVFPEWWSSFRRACRRGRGARPFYRWYFEYLLEEPLEPMRHFIFFGKTGEEGFPCLF